MTKKRANKKKPKSSSKKSTLKELPDTVVRANERLPNIHVPSITISGRTAREPVNSYTVIEPDPVEDYLIHLTSEYATHYLKDDEGYEMTSGYQISIEDILKVREESINQFEFIIMLESAQVPLSYYLITRRNNRIDYYEEVEDGPPANRMFYHILVAEGNYTEDELMVAIEDLLNHNSSIISYNLSYNTITHKTEILTNSLNSGTTYATEFYFNHFNLNTISRVIGFSKDIKVKTVTGIFAIPAVGDQTVNLRGFGNLYIKSNLNSSNIYHPRTGALSDLLGKISIAQPLRTMLHFVNNNTDFKIKINNNHIRLLTLELVDVSGNLIDLNGEHWDCTIQVSRKRLKTSEIALNNQE